MKMGSNGILVIMVCCFLMFGVAAVKVYLAFNVAPPPAVLEVQERSNLDAYGVVVNQ
jgi:hypothetical protein